MEKSVINASLSTQNLTFRAGDTPVSFEVTVNNDSDRFILLINYPQLIKSDGAN